MGHVNGWGENSRWGENSIVGGSSKANKTVSYVAQRSSNGEGSILQMRRAELQPHLCPHGNGCERAASKCRRK